MLSVSYTHLDVYKRQARGSEIKLIPTVNVKDIQKEADNIAKQVRLLDNLLQSANWTTELIES